MGFLEGLEKCTRIVQAVAGVEWEKFLVRENKGKKGDSRPPGESAASPTPVQKSISTAKGSGKPQSQTPTPSPSGRPAGVPDDVLISDARRRLKDEGLKLREHLTQGCTISGYPCDCCDKGAVFVDHALEDVLAVNPGDEAALEFKNWIAGHRSELEANRAIEQKRGLVLASEVRSHLKACGVAQEAPTTSLESLGLRVQKGEISLEQAQQEARKMGELSTGQ